MSDVSPGTASRRPWAAAIVGLVVINTLLLASQKGVCFDYVPESGLESICTIEPAIGVPAMWIVGILSILAVAYCVYRLARFRLSSRS